MPVVVGGAWFWGAVSVVISGCSPSAANEGRAYEATNDDRTIQMHANFIVGSLIGRFIGARAISLSKGVPRSHRFASAAYRRAAMLLS